MARYPIQLEHVAEVEAYITAPIRVGPSSWGTRLIFPVVDGGTVSGPKLAGKIRPFGADWGLVRPDGCFELDVRIVIETQDGALIHAAYQGLIPMNREQSARLLAGEIQPGLSLFITPRFETGHERYQWLTRVQLVGRGAVERESDRIKVSYSWYALTA